MLTVKIVFHKLTKRHIHIFNLSEVNFKLGILSQWYLDVFR